MAFSRPATPARAPLARWSGRILALAAFSLALAAAFAPAARAGEIHPAVQDQLSKMSATDQATVLFVLDRQVDVAALDNALRIEHATRQERHRRVVEALQRVAAESQPAFLAEVTARSIRGDISGFTPYWITNLVVVRGTRAAIEDLAARSDVGMVEYNVKAEPIEPVGQSPATGERGIGVTPGLRAINAPQVWYQLGINGTGAIVANCDTGVDGNHPALQSRWRGNNGHPWQECWHDVLGGGTNYPTDGGGHGTHTMGTITGLGAATQDTIGVAWGAQWIAANPINQGVGSEFDNDIINCYQWFADPDGNPNTVDDVPDIVQNSWRINEGFGGNYTDCDTRWWAVLDNCEAASVVTTWSAGNEGPGSQTIGSPPDRATTALNSFSVGAVNATSYGWPYPIASWSSRGPTGCNVPPELKIKPEVCAPGVSVYSSYPGGSYVNMDGTSMAGPHVAGVVGLMRSANPDIDVQTIKQILIDTARDEGTAGEDNTYGWGFIDAYQAVLRCLSGYGTLAGTITNGSNGGTPVPLANVRLVEINRTFTTDDNGHYSGMAAAGTYTVEVTHPSFATLTVPGVVITENLTTAGDYSLTDVVGPVISDVAYPHSVQNPNDPIAVQATISDFTALGVKELIWRVNGGAFSTVAMTGIIGQDRYQGLIPAQPIGSTVEFYIHASDLAGNQSVSPFGAPGTLYQMFVVQSFFTDDAESDHGWTLFESGDTGSGRWVRMDPWGTQFNGQQVEPADDHTPSPGVKCFVTGAGSQGGSPGASDVDNGCVTLTSPALDLSQAQSAIVSYWRWFANIGGNGSGSFTAKVSSNNGATWTNLENFSNNANSWNQATFNLTGLIAFSNQVKVRFVVCDTAPDDLIEGAIDDFAIEGVPVPPTSVEPQNPVAGTQLYPNHPNPFTNETVIRYRTASAGPATVSVYDPSGRLVRTLFTGQVPAGEHAATWNAKDDGGHPVAAGVYFYELKTDGFRSERKMLVLK